MLRKCRHIFGKGKAAVLDVEFCVSKVILELEAKDVYTGALTKKRCYWQKGFPGNLIDTHF